MPEDEATWLRACRAVLARPVIDIPDGARSAGDLSADQATVAELDDLFWQRWTAA